MKWRNRLNEIAEKYVKDDSDDAFDRALLAAFRLGAEAQREKIAEMDDSNEPLNVALVEP